MIKVHKDIVEANVIRNFAQSNEQVDTIVQNLVELGKNALSREFSYTKLTDEYTTLDRKGYDSLNEKLKKAVLSFMANKAGYNRGVENASDVARLFESTTAKEIYNSIIVEALESIILGAEPRGILRLANIDDVDLGDSKTYHIEPKGIPVAQRNSYTSNVALLDGTTTESITVVPKPYSLGIQMDYIRILDGSYDFGREVAKVAMAMLYAQYKLVVSALFDTTKLAGTPFYAATFNQNDFIKKTSALRAINGTSQLVAYGTIPAFNAIGTVLTQNFGFMAQDAMIKDGVLGSALGVPNIVLDQGFDGSVPLEQNLSNLLISDDLILVVAGAMDKPVKLVRERFVRSIEVEPTDGAIYRKGYKYFMSFEAAVITQNHYMLQSTTV